MVNKINDWFVNQCPNSCDGQVDAVGANDIELAWNEPDPTIDWLMDMLLLQNIPCITLAQWRVAPGLNSPDSNCHWYDKEKVWYAIWGSPPVLPLPEIYRNDGVSAEQWYLMSVYSYKNHGEKIHFVGPMTELKACQQNGDECYRYGVRIDNSPINAWNQMNKLLNGDPRRMAKCFLIQRTSSGFGNKVTMGHLFRFYQQHKLYWILFFLGLILACVFLFSQSQTALGSLREKWTDPSMGKDADMVQGLREALSNQRLNDVDRSSLQKKLELAERLAAQRATKPAVRAPKKAVTPLAVPGLSPLLTESSQPIPDEIIPGSEGIVRPWEADIRNLWQGEREGWYYQVLAGAAPEDEKQGLILVIRTNLDQSQRSQQFYLAPENSGVLKVLEVQGMKVLLTGADSGPISFDLTTRKFQK